MVPGNHPMTSFAVTGTARHVNHTDDSFSVTIGQFIADAILSTALTMDAFLSSAPQ